MSSAEHDLYRYYRAKLSLRYRIKEFAKRRGIELTITIVGLLIGMATVLVSYQVGNQQQILQASRATDSYFNGITDLFAKSIDENQRLNLVIIARTDAIIEDLEILHKPDKLASVINFISNLNPKLFYKDFTSDTLREKYINLSHIRLEGSMLHNLNLQNARLSATILRGADLSYSNLQSAVLKKADLQKAHLQFTNFKNANLQGANFKNAEIEQAIFLNANLGKAIWVNGVRCKAGSIGKCVQ